MQRGVWVHLDLRWGIDVIAGMGLGVQMLPPSISIEVYMLSLVSVNMFISGYQTLQMVSIWPLQHAG